MTDGVRVGAVAWRVLPAVALVAATSLLVRLTAAQEPGPVVQPVYGHDMLDVVRPHWMRLATQWLRSPAFVVAIAAGLVALVVVARRAGVGRAAALAGTWLGANLTVQAVKRGLVPLAPGVGAPQLSGHTAVAAGAALAVVLALPAGRRAWGAVLVGVLLVLTGVGVVLVGWHTPVQAAASVLLTAAWAAVLAPWAHGRGRNPEPPMSGSPRFAYPPLVWNGPPRRPSSR